MHDAAPSGRARFLIQLQDGLTALVLCLLLIALVTGNVRGAFIFGGATALLGAFSLGLRRRPALGPLLHTATLCVCWVVAVLLAVFNGGGIGAPANYVLPVLPALAAFVLGPRAALGWAVAAALPPLAFVALREHIPASSMPPSTRFVMQALGPLGSTALVTMTGLAWARAEAAQRAQTEAARAAAERASAAKSDWLASTSHDLRTPLTAIVGSVDLLTHGAPLPTSAGPHLHRMQSAADALLGLIDNVLDLSRIEAGRVELSAAPCDVGEVLTEVAELIRPAVEGRGVRLTVRCDGPLPVRADRVRLRQIVQNLASNAARFTTEGEIRLRAAASPDPDAAGSLRVELLVEDTGPGIPPGQLDRLLSPYTQAPGPRRAGGFGLGLSIVRGLVHALSGELQLDSAPGQGTRARVRLRLPAAVLPPRPAPAPAAPPPGVRALLVDDNPVNREVGRALLERLGCEVRVAVSGAGALALSETNTYDIYLIDYQMPEMDGDELARRLRAAGVGAPLIALTAAATPEDRAACLAAGMQEVATKPIPLAELRALLARWAPAAAGAAPPARGPSGPETAL